MEPQLGEFDRTRRAPTIAESGPASWLRLPWGQPNGQDRPMCRTVKWARQTKPNDLDKVRPPPGPVGGPGQWTDQN